MAFNVYRIIGGVGVGLASAICPMYIAEVAPSNLRGTLVSWNQFAIIFGQLVVDFGEYLGDKYPAYRAPGEHKRGRIYHDTYHRHKRVDFHGLLSLSLDYSIEIMYIYA